VVLIFKIAWRNLFRHRGQSLVVGAILFLGALLMTLGNGVVSGMDVGLHETVVQGFTGDLVLVPNKQESNNVFMEMMGRPVEPLANFTAIEKALEKNPLVKSLLPMGKNMAMVINEDEGMPTYIYLLGVDFKRYGEMFPKTLDLKEGHLPEPGKAGLLLPLGARKEIYTNTNIWFIPAGSKLDTTQLEGDAKLHREELSVKSSMVLLGFNQENSTTDIRLDVDGLFRFRSLNTIFGSFALVDIESYRQCLGYFRASERTRGKVTGKDSALFALESKDLDALFSDEASLVATLPATQNPVVNTTTLEIPGASPQLILGAISPATQVTTTLLSDLDQGAYNIVLLLLQPGVDAVAAMKELNALFKRENLGVHAVTWKQSLGTIGSLASLIKSALFVFVSFLFVVAVIIIINTLSMAAMERTSEIGMMRAIGARKSFITWMFLTETALLSLFFGGLGIVTGAVAVTVVSQFRITSANDMLQLFFGGDTFKPLLTPGDFVLALIQLALVSVAAVVYPLWLARRMTPLDAVSKE
jgi:ABC-type lipoprotein release transport system permease subunit